VSATENLALMKLFWRASWMPRDSKLERNSEQTEIA
jgi:hypothetical protein